MEGEVTDSIRCRHTCYIYQLGKKKKTDPYIIGGDLSSCFLGSFLVIADLTLVWCLLLYVRHIIVTHWRRFRGVWSRTSQTWDWSNFSRYSSYILVSAIIGVECASNPSNNNSSIGLLEVWFYLLLVAYVQGRKESWFIPTKLATNLSVSLTDSSSRKQVCFFVKSWITVQWTFLAFSFSVCSWFFFFCLCGCIWFLSSFLCVCDITVT